MQPDDIDEGPCCPMQPAFDNREIATILAALRYWQLAQNSASRIPIAIDDISTDFGELEPLGKEEIDGLCMKINCEDIFTNG